MPPAHDPFRDPPVPDTFLRIEINPPLPCGVYACERPARHARVERDPQFGPLWRLLPICETHLRSLDVAVTDSPGDLSLEAPQPPDE